MTTPTNPENPTNGETPDLAPLAHCLLYTSDAADE